MSELEPELELKLFESRSWSWSGNKKFRLHNTVFTHRSLESPSTEIDRKASDFWEKNFSVTSVKKYKKNLHLFTEHGSFNFFSQENILFLEKFIFNSYGTYSKMILLSSSTSGGQSYSYKVTPLRN